MTKNSVAIIGTGALGCLALNILRLQKVKIDGSEAGERVLKIANYRHRFQENLR